MYFYGKYFSETYSIRNYVKTSVSINVTNKNYSNKWTQLSHIC